MIQKEIINQYEVKLHEQVLKLFHASGMKLHDNTLGSRVYTNYQRLSLIVLFTRSRKALRDFVSELRESKWPRWLGLREIPSKSVLHNWLKRWDLSRVRQLLATTVANEKPKTMAIDATGFDSWARSRHYNKRLKECGLQNPHLPYNKADLLVDTDSKLVHDFVLRTKPRHDVLGARSIFKRFKWKNCLILADKGYDSEELHQLLADSGNEFYAPVRDFKVKRPKGPFRRQCLSRHEKYYQRNIVESVNFSLKSRFRSLRSKLHFMKKREFAWKLVTYNLEKLSAFLQLIKKVLFAKANYYLLEN